MSKVTKRLSTFTTSLSDSLRNFLTGLGGENDNSTTNTVGAVHTSRHEATVLYKHYWLARKVINIPIDDMLKNGRTIMPTDGWDADDIKLYQDAWDALQVDKHIANAMRWAALYGGCLLYTSPSPRD